ncbi:hypothetical protein TNCV_3134931 [Trichonephila clavipes]|nr:hypothetical protein TNCV_3134931 [Trichonephila clavipes]
MTCWTGKMKQRSPKNSFNTGSNDMLNRSNDMLDRSHDMLDGSNDMLERSNEMDDTKCFKFPTKRFFRAERKCFMPPQTTIETGGHPQMKCWTGPMKCWTGKMTCWTGPMTCWTGPMTCWTGKMKQRSPKNSFNTGSNDMLDR